MAPIKKFQSYRADVSNFWGKPAVSRQITLSEQPDPKWLQDPDQSEEKEHGEDAIGRQGRPESATIGNFPTALPSWLPILQETARRRRNIQQG